MSQECVRQGVCRSCGSVTVITSDPHNYSGIWCTRTATCVNCYAVEEYVYELKFIGYEKPGGDDILSAPPTAIEKLVEFRLEAQPVECEEDSPFFSEDVLEEVLTPNDARALLALWKKIVEAGE